MMLSVVTSLQLQEDILLMLIHIFLRLDSYIKLGLEVTLFLSEVLPRDAPRGMLSACLQSKLQGLDHCCLW